MDALENEPRTGRAGPCGRFMFFIVQSFLDDCKFSKDGPTICTSRPLSGAFHLKWRFFLNLSRDLNISHLINV